MTAREKNSENDHIFTSNPIVSVKDPKKFNEELLQGRIEQHNMKPDKGTDVIFFDRGIPDVYAYMDCFGQTYDKNFEEAGYTYRYDQILLMPPWKEIHTIDNERFESFEESERIFECLKKAYINFGYSVVPVPKGSVEKRTAYILEHLSLN